MEIYHNVAAKNSDSDESHPTRNKRSQLTMVQRQPMENHMPPENIPPLNILNPIKTEPYPHVPEIKTEIIATPQPVKTSRATTYDPPDAPRTISCYSKNYELPTIASRLKQVAKCYLNTFNFKVFYFVCCRKNAMVENFYTYPFLRLLIFRQFRFAQLFRQVLVII